jgi:hypothetical protein
LKAVKERKYEVLYYFIISYIESGNKIINDGWPGYIFLNELEVYDWEDSNHGVGAFVFCLNSISHIEQLWIQLKTIIRKIYNDIPCNNFLLFLREI